MDSIIQLSNISYLKPIETELRSARLLSIYGCNGEELIYATDDDQVYGYGRNRFGGLGLGHNHENIEIPQLNPTLSGKRVIDFFCGYEHWIAVTASGQCYAWGHNQFGQLGIKGIDKTETPRLITSLSDNWIVEISCGAHHTLALTSDGKVFTFGNNKSGQLGDGTKGWRWKPMKLSVNERVISISSGKNHCLIATESGRPYGWGHNCYGQLGRNPEQEFISFYPNVIPGLDNEVVVKVVSGCNYSLLLTSDNTVYAFGENMCGQIGNGSAANQFVPFKVDLKFKDIIAYKENDLTIGITPEDLFYVWGIVNNRRQTIPKAIDSSGQSVFDIYLKLSKTKVVFKTITTNREQFDWKSIRESQESNGFNSFKSFISSKKSSSDSVNPCNRLKTLDDLIDIINFPSLYWTLFDDKIRNKIRMIRVFGKTGNKVIFATNEDKVYGYGFNRDLTLGLGTTDERIRKPILNPFLSFKQLIDISPGFEHCIGLTASGQCYSWGNNKYGQLGIGNTDNTPTPQHMEELADLHVIQVCCGCYHSMALTSDGDLFSWGHNTFAQLGDNTYNSRDRPTQVLIPAKVKAITSGFYHSLALSESGQIYIWGNNINGQLARDPKYDQRGRQKPMSPRPRVIEEFSRTVITKAVCGPNHTLLLTTDGYVYAFGENRCGQIGNGSTDNQFTPLRLNKNIKIKEIICHFEDNISLAVSETNKCYIWGFVGNRNVLRPKAIPDSSDRLFDVFSKYCSDKMMFETVNVNTIEDMIAANILNTEEHNFETDFSFIDVSQLMNHNKNNEETRLDDMVDVNLFPNLDSTLNDHNLRQNIRLLYVFGRNGSKIIYITNDDKVYAFGDNSDGCLGLGTDDKFIQKPTLNTVLSGQNIIEINCGDHHCIGLTSRGQCLAWGENGFGQLGIGIEMASDVPTLIRALNGQFVVQVSCGANHTLVLTKSAQVYAWGQNNFAQLGDKTYINRLVPKHIPIKHPIASICAGRNHSFALITFGLIYLWGHNEFGQLGRNREYDYKAVIKNWASIYPAPNVIFKNVQFIKGVCGPNYTLLLTIEGNVYAFGDNTSGQIGNESVWNQYQPIRVNNDIIFKDIFSHLSNDLSIGLSIDNQFYVWGLADNKKVLSPQLISDSNKEDLVFNVYAKYAKNKVTFKSVVVGSNDNQLNQIYDTNDNHFNATEESDYKSFSVESKEQSNDSSADDPNSLAERQSILSESISMKTPNSDLIPANISANSLQQSFNNQNNFDFMFKCEDKVIYCHKTILEIRNKKFWQTVSERLTTSNEITINRESYEPFYTFLQYMYGLEPEISETVVTDLQTMAKYFEEPQLSYLCSQYIKYYERSPNLSNVCSLYERALNDGLTDLEKSCVEFAANNWKAIVKSKYFELLDDSLSKRLMCSVINL